MLRKYTLCVRTGNLAQYSFRTSSDDDLVVLGEKEAYEPLSRAAFFKERKKAQQKKSEKKKVTQLTIDLNCLTHNYHVLRNQWSSQTKMIAVVKANAYGLGAVEIAKHLVKLGCDYLAVAYAQEGVELREAGIKTPLWFFVP